MDVIVMGILCGLTSIAVCVWCAWAHAVAYPNGRREKKGDKGHARTNEK